MMGFSVFIDRFYPLKLEMGKIGAQSLIYDWRQRPVLANVEGKVMRK